MAEPEVLPNEPQPARLGMWDAVSIILGIVIGSAIFQASGTIAAGVASPAGMFGVWLAGGALSVVGALCYAELASTYPRSGGDYVWVGNKLTDPNEYQRILTVGPGQYDMGSQRPRDQLEAQKAAGVTVDLDDVRYYGRALDDQAILEIAASRR